MDLKGERTKPLEKYWILFLEESVDAHCDISVLCSEYLFSRVVSRSEIWVRDLSFQLKFSLNLICKLWSIALFR